MTYLQKYVLQKNPKDINIKVFDMITNKNEAKAMKKIFHVVVNSNSMVQHIIQLNNRVIKHVDVNVKVLAYTKKSIVGILAHVFVRIAST